MPRFFHGFIDSDKIALKLHVCFIIQMSLTQGGQHLLYFFHIAAERRGGFPYTVGQLAKFILGRIFKINFQSALGDVLSGFLYFLMGSVMLRLM